MPAADREVSPSQKAPRAESHPIPSRTGQAGALCIQESSLSFLRASCAISPCLPLPHGGLLGLPILSRGGVLALALRFPPVLSHFQLLDAQGLPTYHLKSPSRVMEPEEDWRTRLSAESSFS